MTAEHEVFNPRQTIYLGELTKRISALEIDLAGPDFGEKYWAQRGKRQIAAEMGAIGAEIALGKNSEDEIFIENPLQVVVSPQNIYDWLVDRKEKRFKRVRTKSPNLVYKPTHEESSINTVQVKIGYKEIKIQIERKGNSFPWKRIINPVKRAEIIKDFKEDIHRLLGIISFAQSLPGPVQKADGKRVRNDFSNEGYLFSGCINGFKTDVVNFAALVQEGVAMKIFEADLSTFLKMSVDEEHIQTSSFGALNTEFRQGKVVVQIRGQAWELFAIRSTAPPTRHFRTSKIIPATDTTSFYIKRASTSRSQNYK